MKKYKLTVKPFANTDVKPHRCPIAGDLYPLYIRILYRRRQTKLKLPINGLTVLINKDFDFSKPHESVANKLHAINIMLQLEIYANPEWNVIESKNVLNWIINPL